MSPRQKSTYLAMIGTGLILTAVWALWWFDPSHIPSTFHGYFHILDFLLFGILSYIAVHQITGELLLWSIASDLKRAKRIKPAPSQKVAFITTFVPSKEPITLLEKTLPAMVAADYPHDTWLLDEGNDSKARLLCENLGVQYFSRKDVEKYNQANGIFAAKTKGGNHNAWYDQHGGQYDIVAQIDTDFIPKKRFLTRTIGYFRDPNIAFVGTPQIYGNVSESLVARGAAEQTYGFYGPILRGLSSKDMTLLIGANHVVRVSALKEIGLYSAHLTEDLLTGMNFHSRSWKSVYVPEALAIGEGPSTWDAKFNQQMRWAFGCMDVLLKHSPKLLRDMRFSNALRYYVLQQHYFTGVAMVLGIALLTLYFVTGIQSSNISLLPLFEFYVPLLLWQLLIATWLQRFNVRPKNESGPLLAGKIVSIAAWPIYFMAFIGVLRGKHLSFKVTPKGGTDNPMTPLRIFKPHLIIGSVTAGGIILSFFTHHQAPVLEFWAGLNTLLMFSLVGSVALKNHNDEKGLARIDAILQSDIRQIWA